MIKIKVCDATQFLGLQELKPLEKNPRKIDRTQKQRLTHSIEVRGIFKPFLVWVNKKESFCIGGNQRLEIIKEKVKLKEWDLTSLPIVIFKGTEAEALAVALEDNQSAGEWDYDLLPDYISDLTLLEPAFDLSLTGFHDQEVQFFLGMNEPTGLPAKDFDDLLPEDELKKEDERKGHISVTIKVPKGEPLARWKEIVKTAKADGARTPWDVLSFLIDKKQ